VQEEGGKKKSTKGSKTKVSSCSNDPKSIKPNQRYTEFVNKLFTVSGGKLFCTACREELSLEQSIIKNHIQSGKHTGSKEIQAKEKS